MSLLLLLNTGGHGAAPAFAVEVDWNNDGDFGDAGETITADVRELATERGRDSSSTFTGVATAATLRCELLNASGTYSPSNAASPLAGLMRAGRAVRVAAVSTGGPVSARAHLFAGALDRIEPSASAAGAVPSATLVASGPLARLAGQRARWPRMTGATTGTIINRLLLAPTVTLVSQQPGIDLGQTAVSRWGVGEGRTLDHIRAVERSELGFFHERADGSLAFEDRHHRLRGDHRVARATYTDSGAPGTLGYAAIREGSIVDSIANTVEARVRRTVVDPVAVLWTYDGAPPQIGPGETVTLVAEYPNDASGGGAWVDTWTATALGTDVTCTGVPLSSLSVVLFDFGMAANQTATTKAIRILNSHPTRVATLTKVQARGTPVRRLAETVTIVEDAASQAVYGVQALPLPGEWIPDEVTARAYGGWVVRRLAGPRPGLTVTIPASADAAHMAECLGREISDRVALVGTGAAKLGLAGEYHVEAISHRLRPGPLLETTFELSVAEAANWWELGVAALGTSTRLAF